MELIKSFDYIVFAVELLVSLGIGILYSRRQTSEAEYAHGQHNIPLIPVILSLMVSFTSSISMQGYPGEVYLYGIEFCFITAGIFGQWMAIVTFVPLFYELRLESVYEYLDLRYNSKFLKVAGTLSSTLSSITYAAVIFLAPAQALESIMGIPTRCNIIIMGVVCVIYTTIGGLRGVIWTDVFQSVIMTPYTVVRLRHTSQYVKVLQMQEKTGDFHEFWHFFDTL